MGESDGSRPSEEETPGEEAEIIAKPEVKKLKEVEEPITGIEEQAEEKEG